MRHTDGFHTWDPISFGDAGTVIYVQKNLDKTDSSECGAIQPVNMVQAPE